MFGHHKYNGSKNKMHKAFSKKINKQQNNINTNDIKIYHTADYTCINDECATHKDPEIKEAIFYTKSNGYKIEYQCMICEADWYKQ